MQIKRPSGQSEWPKSREEMLFRAVTVFLHLERCYILYLSILRNFSRGKIPLFFNKLPCANIPQCGTYATLTFNANFTYFSVIYPKNQVKIAKMSRIFIFAFFETFLHFIASTANSSQNCLKFTVVRRNSFL